VTERRQLEVPPRPANRRYMETKQTKFGHLLSMVGERRDTE
jgi:GTP cyclohydrolase II